MACSLKKCRMISFIVMTQVPNIGVIGSGGGFRAMTAYSGVFSALVDSHILDMTTYAGGLSGSAWYVMVIFKLYTAVL